MTKEKQELIQSINEIREDIALDSYGFEEMEKKSVEELTKIYERHQFMREEYAEEKKTGSEKNFLMIIPVAIVVTIILYLIFFPNILSPPVQTRQPHYEYFIGFAYINGNDGIFSLQNKGDNITSFSVVVEGYNRDYEIKEGSLPIETGKILYFKIWSVCDGNVHFIETRAHGATSNYTISDGCSGA